MKDVYVIYEVEELFAMLDECCADLNNILGKIIIINKNNNRITLFKKCQ